MRSTCPLWGAAVGVVSPGAVTGPTTGAADPTSATQAVAATSPNPAGAATSGVLSDTEVAGVAVVTETEPTIAALSEVLGPPHERADDVYDLLYDGWTVASWGWLSVRFMDRASRPRR